MSCLPENVGQYAGNQDFEHISCEFWIPWWPLRLQRRRMKVQPAWLGSSRWLVHGCWSGGGGPCCAKLLPVFQLRWVSMCLSTCFHLFSHIECSGLRLPPPAAHVALWSSRSACWHLGSYYTRQRWLQHFHEVLAPTWNTRRYVHRLSPSAYSFR